MATCKECRHNEMCYATHTDDSPACCDFKDCSKYVVREKGEWEGTSCSRCGGSYIRRYALARLDFDMEVIGNIHDNPELLEVGER